MDMNDTDENFSMNAFGETVFAWFSIPFIFTIFSFSYNSTDYIASSEVSL